MTGPKGFKQKTMTSSVHVVLPSFLMQRLWEWARRDNTSLTKQIEIAILLRMFNYEAKE